MKSLSKILIRYLATAVLIVLSVLFFNILLYIFLTFQLLHSNSFIERNTREIAAEFISEGNVPVLSEKGSLTWKVATPGPWCWTMAEQWCGSGACRKI